MKLGRNEPCHCGSGKKYKYCHYEEDRAAETAALREAAEQAAADADDSEGEAGEEPASDERGAARAESTGRRKHDGSRFMRGSSRGGGGGAQGQTDSGGGRTSRTTRGAQRGG